MRGEGTLSGEGVAGDTDRASSALASEDNRFTGLCPVPCAAWFESLAADVLPVHPLREDVEKHRRSESS